nr:hypothetical protein [Planctomycetota bacterium]
MRTTISFCALLGCLLVTGVAFSQDATDPPDDSSTATQNDAAETGNGESDDSSKVEEQEPASDEAGSDEPESELSPELTELRDRVRRCLAYYFYRPETTARRSPCGVMHTGVGFGVDKPLVTGNQQA